MLQPSAGSEISQLSLTDVARLLRIMGEIATVRSDPRRWRMLLLGEMNQLLQASASAAFIVRDVVPGIPPLVVSVFDSGFKQESQRQAFLHEYNVSPFNDPLSRAALEGYMHSGGRASTSLRGELVSDAAWYGAAEVVEHRRAAGIDDCVFSIHAGADRTQAFVLCAFRPWGASPFGQRERVLLETMHTAVEALYRSEEATGRLSRAAELSPRVRETLDHLLSGLTERQVAGRMELSVHTVHDYVKMLYAHFGVSSRSELLARWLRIGGTLPERRLPESRPQS